MSELDVAISLDRSRGRHHAALDRVDLRSEVTR